MGLFGKKAPKETIEDILTKHDFKATKTIYSGTAILGQPSVFMDDEHKKWAVCYGKKAEPKIFGYSDIINCDIYENGGSVSKGHAGSALVGGALLGATGAIIGASRGKKQIGTCNSLSVQIAVNDPNSPSVVIPLISSQTKTDSFTYRTFAQTAQNIVASFDYMKNSAQADKPDQQNISAADEIKKFKGLLDSGAITQEEFDAKKKQLLGL